MQSTKYYYQILIKPEEVAKIISCYARVCKFIRTNSKPSHYYFWGPPVGEGLLIHEVLQHTQQRTTFGRTLLGG